MRENMLKSIAIDLNINEISVTINQVYKHGCNGLEF